MVHKIALALPILALSLLTSAGPLQQRDASPVAGSSYGEVFKEDFLSDMEEIMRDISDGEMSAMDDMKMQKPSQCGKGSTDKCCVWFDVSAELTRLFVGQDKQCNDNARGAVRMGFHDAGSWEQGGEGGADGSLIMDFGEQDRRENNGLQNIRKVLRDVQKKYKVGYADLVQYAHNHATVSCPKGPRIRTFIGRKDATKGNPTGLLPDTKDKPDNLIALFKKKGISERELAALLGAHTTARQRFVDTSPAAVNKPLDSTNGVWDVEFYNDTLSNPSGATANQKVFVLPSDKALSQHPNVKNDWRSFVNNQGGWNREYARAYIKVSMFGVKKDELNKMVDCTKTLPAARNSFP